jgi:hypothetical protein
METIKRRRRKLKANKIRQQDGYLKCLRTQFVKDIVKLGFTREDVELIVKLGIYAHDRNLAVDQLSLMKNNPK